MTVAVVFLEVRGDSNNDGGGRGARSSQSHDCAVVIFTRTLSQNVLVDKR